MKNKKFLPGLLVMVLALGMTVVGCDNDSTEEDSNPYIGDWSGTFAPSEGTAQEAKITFTDTNWTLTTDTDVPITGPYTRGTFGATLSLNTDQGVFPVTSNTLIILDQITVTFIAGIYDGYTGTFTKIKEKTDPFKGTWSGTFTPSGGTAQEATIVFTDTNWTLTATNPALNLTGTYTKSTIGYTATLQQQTTELGIVSIGTGVVNPTATPKTLTVRITAGNYSGASGSFTPATQ